MTAPLTELEHREISSQLSTMVEGLTGIRAKLRGCSVLSPRALLDASKALASLRSLRLSMVEHRETEHKDTSRAVYFP